MKHKFWIRLGVALLIVLLLWWLYVAILVDEDEAFAFIGILSDSVVRMI